MLKSWSETEKAFLLITIAIFILICGAIVSMVILILPALSYVQTTRAPVLPPTPQIIQWEGEGDDVLPVTVSGKTFRVGGSYVGDGTFFVKILDTDGRLVQLAANCSTDCDFDHIIGVDGPGTYYIQTTITRGVWGLVIALP